MHFITQENPKGDKLKTARIYPSSDQYNQFYAHAKPLCGKIERVFNNNKIEMPGKICSVLIVYPPDGDVFMEVVFMPPRNLIVNNGVKPNTRYVKQLKPSVMWTTHKNEAMLLTEEEVKVAMLTATHLWNNPQTETVELEEVTEKDNDDSSDN